MFVSITIIGKIYNKIKTSASYFCFFNKIELFLQKNRCISHHGT